MRQQINLYQSGFRKQKQRFAAHTLGQAALAVAAGIALFTVLNLWQTSRLDSGLKDIDQQYTVVVGRFQAISQTLAARPRDVLLEQDVARMEKLIEGRNKVQEMLKQGVFTNSQGFSRYFAAFARQRVEGLWLTRFSITGSAQGLALEGRSKRPELIPRFIQKLSNEEILAGTEFRVFRLGRPEDEKKRTKPYVEFLVTTDESLLGQIGQDGTFLGSAQVRQLLKDGGRP